MSSKSLKERIAELIRCQADCRSIFTGKPDVDNTNEGIAIGIGYSLPIIEAQEQEIERLKKYEPVVEAARAFFKISYRPFTSDGTDVYDRFRIALRSLDKESTL